MSVKGVGTLILVLGWIVFYLIAWVAPFLYVWSTGRRRVGFAWSWGTQVVVMFIWALPAGDYCFSIDPRLVEGWPEGNSVVAAVMMGWVFAGVIVYVAHLLHGSRAHRGKGQEFFPSEKEP